jgi:hypothetical protein
MTPGALLLIAIPLAIVALAVLIPRRYRPRLVPCVECMPQPRLPGEPMDNAHREKLWRQRREWLTVEQQIAGSWPFQPTAVHALPREMQTDPRELLQ